MLTADHIRRAVRNSHASRGISPAHKERERDPAERGTCIDLHSVAQRYLPRQCRMFWKKLCLFGPKLLRKRDFCRCSIPLLMLWRILDRLCVRWRASACDESMRLIYVWNPALLSRRRCETSSRHKRGWKRGRDARSGTVNLPDLSVPRSAAVGLRIKNRSASCRATLPCRGSLPTTGAGMLVLWKAT